VVVAVAFGPSAARTRRASCRRTSGNSASQTQPLASGALQLPRNRHARTPASPCGH